MAGKRKRRRVRRRRRWAVPCGALAVLGAVLLAWPSPGPQQPHRADRSSSVPLPVPSALALQPTAIARARHLDSTYVAPASEAVSAGELLIGRVHIDAPVVEAGWDRDAMAVPNRVDSVGWLTGTARPDDVAGTSLVAGHVSDAQDRPGAFGSLAAVRIGDVVDWRLLSGVSVRFRVISIARYPRAAGLPTSLFRVDGPHILRLVTCTHRVAGAAGFHYTDNLVVSAREIGRSSRSSA